MIEKPNNDIVEEDSTPKRKARRQYGADTEAGIAYREQLAEDRANQLAADKRLNKKLMVVGAVLCAAILAINIPMIVSRSKNLSLLTQTAISKQAELKEIEDNPKHDVVRKEADVINAHDVAEYVCNSQNTLSNYVFEEAKNDESMSKDHIVFLEDYNKFCEDTQLSSMHGLPTTWLGSALDAKYVSKSSVKEMPYTWVCNNDYDLIGTDVKIVWECYMYYGTDKQELVMTIMAHYSSDTNTFSQFETYYTDTYNTLYKDNQIQDN